LLCRTSPAILIVISASRPLLAYAAVEGKVSTGDAVRQEVADIPFPEQTTDFPGVISIVHESGRECDDCGDIPLIYKAVLQADRLGT
jgi:hypothetical protein